MRLVGMLSLSPKKRVRREFWLRLSERKPMETTDWNRFSASSPWKLWFVPLLISLSITVSTSEQLTLHVAQPTTLNLSSGLPVQNSPGAKKGAMMVCERVHIHGLSRLYHLKKYAHSVKVKVKALDGSPNARLANPEVCFHRNISLGIGMCPQGQWEKLVQGSWVRPMSPYDDKLLDIRMPIPLLENIEVSIEEEFLLYRIIFLVCGIFMLTVASTLSNSIAFYYSSAMVVGIILVILMVLFQGMKLLPTGRKNSLAMVIYSSMLGVGSLLFRYLPRLLRSLLAEIGMSDDMYYPVVTSILVCLLLTGAWLGFWVVRKVVLTEDGSIDLSVALFVAWSIRIFAALMIIQSSLDPLLAAEALVSGVTISSIVRAVIRSRSLQHLCEHLFKTVKNIDIKFLFEESYGGYIRRPQKSEEMELLRRRKKRVSPTSCTSPVKDRAKATPSRSSESEVYYSTFHNTPERKQFTKEEWEKFTRDSTKNALEDLVSSPDFSKWAIRNAERLTLAPAKNHSGSLEQRGRWFRWF